MIPMWKPNEYYSSEDVSKVGSKQPLDITEQSFDRDETSVSETLGWDQKLGLGILSVAGEIDSVISQGLDLVGTGVIHLTMASGLALTYGAGVIGKQLDPDTRVNIPAWEDVTQETQRTMLAMSENDFIRGIATGIGLSAIFPKGTDYGNAKKVGSKTYYGIMGGVEAVGQALADRDIPRAIAEATMILNTARTGAEYVRQNAEAVQAFGEGLSSVSQNVRDFTPGDNIIGDLYESLFDPMVDAIADATSHIGNVLAEKAEIVKETAEDVRDFFAFTA